MNSVFILVFLIMAPFLIRQQMRGIRRDWRLWVSLAIPALMIVVSLSPSLCGKPFPVPLALPDQVGSAAMAVLFMLYLARPTWEILDELRRARDRSSSNEDRQE